MQKGQENVKELCEICSLQHLLILRTFKGDAESQHVSDCHFVVMTPLCMIMNDDRTMKRTAKKKKKLFSSMSVEK